MGIRCRSILSGLGPVVAAGILVGLRAGPAAAEEDPFSLVREEQTVTGAAKRPQPLSETPSAVTIVTAEEIRAHGYRSLGEALRWVRGVFVTDDRNYTYVGVRGLQRPGDYNNKVLITIDGHSMNGNVYADGLFGNELGLDMETVERIEVVRGPGSALYGSNAVLAVVNVVTRRPSREPGITISGRTGTGREGRAFVGIASAPPGRLAWSVNGSWLGARGEDLYFPEYDNPLTHDGVAVDADGEQGHALLGTLEWAGLKLTAKANERMKRFPTGAFGTTFGDRRNRTYDGHDFVELSGARQISPALELNGRLYWDGARYHGIYVQGPDSASYLNFDRGDGDVLGTEWRAHWAPGADQVLTLGAEGQLQPRIEMENYDLQPYALYVSKHLHSHLLAGYVEDERQLGTTATVTAGARVDGYPGFDPVLSPRADLVWRSAPDLTWKLLAGSAFRAPSPYESRYEDAVTILNPTLGPERVITVEGGMVRTSGPASWTLSGYVSRIRGLIDLTQVDTSGTRQFVNRERVLSRGIESELEVVSNGGWRGRLALAWQRSDDEDTDAELTNSPRWNAHLVMTRAPADGRVTAGFGLRYLSPRITLANARTDVALVADARVAVRFGGAELGAEVRNLFDAQYGDPGSREHAEDQILQNRRTLVATFTVHPTVRP
jgi:iron complex outermembrane receptor protein